MFFSGSYSRLYVGSMTLASASQPVLVKTITGNFVLHVLLACCLHCFISNIFYFFSVKIIFVYTVKL